MTSEATVMSNPLSRGTPLGTAAQADDHLAQALCMVLAKTANIEENVISR